MARKLSTPRPPVAVQVGDVTEQWVDSIRLDFAYGQFAMEADGVTPTPGLGIQIDLTKTALEYTIHQGDADGARFKKMNLGTLFHADWPADVLAAVKTLVAYAEREATSRGDMDAGTSTDNL